MVVMHIGTSLTWQGSMDCCDLFQVDSEMMVHECTKSLEGQFTNIDLACVDETVLELVRNETVCFGLRDVVNAHQ